MLTNVFKAHGHLIRHFSCQTVDKNLLSILAEHCPLLEEVELGLGKGAFWMGYEYLERMFRALSQARFQWDGQDQDQLPLQEHGHGQGQRKGEKSVELKQSSVAVLRRLRKVEIGIDMQYLNPTMLWSLCHITHLTDLSINARGSIGQDQSSRCLENLTLSLLECCPRVERFRLYYSPQKMIYPPRGYRSWFKERVWERSQDRRAPPLVPRDAVVRRGVVSTFGQGEIDMGERQEGSLSSAAATNMGSGSGTGEETGAKEDIVTRPFILRQLELRGFYAEMDTLLYLLKRCPLLEQLSLFQSWSSLRSGDWHALTTHCQQTLLSFRLSTYNYNHPQFNDLNVPDLLTSFPQLELLHLDNYPLQQLNLADLDTSLSKFELGQQGRPHPLRALCITGHFDEALARLFDIISCPSLKCLETLKIGYTYMLPMDRALLNTPETSPQGAYYDFTRSWEAVGRTLVRMDLHGLHFPDKQVTAKFFRKLEGFRSLRTLRASVHHFQDIISTSSSSRSSLTLSPSATTKDDAQSCKPAILPAADYHFPFIQDLLIVNYHKMMHDRINDLATFWKGTLSFDQILFLLAATPSIRNLLIQSLTVTEATAAAVRTQFPGLYVDNNCYDNLPWFDALK